MADVFEKFSKICLKIYELNTATVFSWKWCSISKKTDELHNDLPFLPEKKKLKKNEKLLANLHDKTEYVMHIRDLKQALHHGLVLKKFIEWLNLIKKW